MGSQSSQLSQCCTCILHFSGFLIFATSPRLAAGQDRLLGTLSERRTILPPRGGSPQSRISTDPYRKSVLLRDNPANAAGNVTPFQRFAAPVRLFSWSGPLSRRSVHKDVARTYLDAVHCIRSIEGARRLAEGPTEEKSADIYFNLSLVLRRDPGLAMVSAASER